MTANALLDLYDEIDNFKDDLKEAINNKGGSLTSSSPLSDYISEINNIPSAESVLEKTLSGNQIFNVESLGSEALSNNYNMTSLSLPNCISLSERCVQNCFNLLSASLPVYLGWTINPNTGELDRWSRGSGTYCFEFCGNLNTVDISYMYIVPDDFFSGCNLTNITAPNLEGFGYNAFRPNDQLGISYYEYLNNLGIDFMNMKYLAGTTDILRDYVSDSNNNITNTLTFQYLRNFGNEFFDFDTADSSDPLYNITTVSMPKLKRINDWAHFRFCGTILDLPEIVTLRDGALGECPNLTTINIGSDVTYISNNAFENCYNVTTVNIDIDQNTQDQEIIDNVINTAPWGLDQSVTINWLGTQA